MVIVFGCCYCFKEDGLLESSVREMLTQLIVFVKFCGLLLVQMEHQRGGDSECALMNSFVTTPDGAGGLMV